MKRVLVVDDKEEARYYLVALLHGHGWTVDAAHHGAEALAMARRNPPDLVVSDLLMPVMDGYMLLSHWKADERLRGAPFIVYTATYTEPQDEQLALSLGADAFVLKPAEPEELLARLEAVQSSVQANGAARPGSFPGGDDTALGVYSRALVRKLEEKTLQLERANLALQEDIQRRKEMESRLLQAQKMEAVGRLAGGIAHDFNNVLGVIHGYAELLLRESEGAKRIKLEQIIDAAQRAAALTRQLLAFSRKQILAPRVLDLNARVAGLEPMLRRLIGEDVALAIHLAPDLGRVRVDAGQIDQVLMNLCVNARDAMPNGGRLRIETANAEVEEAGASGSEALAPGRYVVLTIADTGHGIEPAILANVFEPFFTTREPGRGTGLGLATVYGIVKQAGGHVDVTSEVGQGSVFTVSLPRIEGPLEAAAEEVPAPAARGSGTILVVEDEPSMRAVTREILEAHGYAVLDADGSAAALETARAFAGPIDLLVTDVVMPGANGLELARSLGKTRPALKVLYLSGYTDDVIAHHGVLDPGILLLPKPFSAAALLERVQSALGR